MERRKLIIGTYDTALTGPWTLAALSCPEPDYQANLVDVPGRDGQLDMSTALTNGVPRYSSRTLEARLECSEGDRAYRLEKVAEIINQLNGQRLDITLPDDPTRYLTGRVTVKTEYNDIAHAAVSLTAICDPWRYNKTETAVNLTAATKEQLTVLPNSGWRVVTPEVTVTGSGSVVLKCDDLTWTLTAGTYRLTDMTLPHGNTALRYSGSGRVSITYREAVL